MIEMTQERLLFWAGASVVIFAVLSAVAGVAAWYLSDRVSAAKDAEYERFKAESAATIAEANARAAEATKGTADALEKAGAANERAGRLEVQAATLRERASVAERDVLQLKERLAWRAITAQQEAALVRSLSKYSGEGLTLFVQAGSEEVSRFASQLRTAFEKAGLIVETNNGTTFGRARSGLAMEVGSARLELANAIGSALFSSAVVDRPVEAIHSRNQNLLLVEVWPK